MSLPDLITLAQAARLLPSRPSPATLWRWHTRGVRGVRLRTWVVGSRRYTTQAALEAFIEALTAASDSVPPAPSVPAARDPSLAARLQAAGVL